MSKDPGGRRRGRSLLGRWLKRHPRARAFLGRRLRPGDYLGLHLTVGLVFSLVLVGLFALIAHYVVGEGAITRFDRSVGLALAAYRPQAPVITALFRGLTFLGSFYFLMPLTLAVALALWLRRRRWLALVWLFAQAGDGLLNAGLKLVFDRPRPEFRDPAVHETTTSFPSGHSMGSVAAYGLLAYLLVRGLPRPWQRLAAAALLAVLALAIGFSRIYLGAHYFSDVLGGFTVGLAWLAVCISGIEVVRRRPLPAKPPPTPPA
jgi:undecaprenyl-diphosphatase